MIRVHRVRPGDTGLADTVWRRMTDFAAAAPLGADPLAEVRRLAAAWAGRSDRLLLLAFLDGAEVVGHAAAEVAGECVVVHQAVLGGPAGDALARGILLADEWGRARGARFMLMAADDRPRAWTRRYGFELSRYLMGRRLGAPIPALGRHRATA